MSRRATGLIVPTITTEAIVRRTKASAYQGGTISLRLNPSALKLSYIRSVIGGDHPLAQNRFIVGSPSDWNETAIVSDGSRALAGGK